jgi:hypothetical protein
MHFMARLLLLWILFGVSHVCSLARHLRNGLVLRRSSSTTGFSVVARRTDSCPLVTSERRKKHFALLAEKTTNALVAAR